MTHKFLADVMLGSLARWLRILGYDTFYDNSICDLEILERAERESRVVLTRDRRLFVRKALAEALFIEEDGLESQLQQVLRYTADPPTKWRVLSRCLECNLPLTEISPAQAHPRVPSYVFQTQPHFHQCLACRRVYWRGTHREKMIDRLKRLLEDQLED